MYIKNIDDYVMDGIIITLDEHFEDKFKNDYKVFNLIANETLKESD